MDDPISIFKQWLANTLILRPVPSLARGESEPETLQPDTKVTNFGSWLYGLLSHAPSSYNRIDEYLKQMMPDLLDIKNPLTGVEPRHVVVQFSAGPGRLTIRFDELSDGEKCFMIYALAIAANEAYGPLLCFWDKPDNYLAPSEVGPSVMALRRAFRDSGQLIVTSHNPEAIRRFSDENTLVLFRNSHLEPTIVRPVEKIRAAGHLKGDIMNALLRGDLGV
jgi:predicted ATPase